MSATCVLAWWNAVWKVTDQNHCFLMSDYLGGFSFIQSSIEDLKELTLWEMFRSMGGRARNKNWSKDRWLRCLLGLYQRHQKTTTKTRKKKGRKNEKKTKQKHSVLSVLSDLTDLLHACTCRGQTSNLPWYVTDKLCHMTVSCASDPRRTHERIV